MTSETFEIPREYGWTLLTAALMLVQFNLMGFWTMSKRIKIFTRDYLKGNFTDDLKEAKERTPAMGYPDMGTGWFAQKLPYQDWFYFNCVMRCHQNLFEYIIVAVVATLTLGLFNAWAGAVLGGVWILLRFVYNYMYTNGGKVQTVGLVCVFWLMGGLGLSLYHLVKELL